MPKVAQRKKEQDRSKGRRVHELEQEIRSLRKQVGRLRKQLDQAQGYDEPEPDDEPATSLVQPESACPQCGSADVFHLATPGGKTVSLCRSCGTRL